MVARLIRKPNISFIQRPEYLQGQQQLLQNKDVICLLAEEDKQTIGLAIGIAREDGVGMLGFPGLQKEHRKAGTGSTLLRSFFEKAKRKKHTRCGCSLRPNCCQP